MEVEARMKRNYLPPSIQGQYQGPPTPGPTNVPQSPTQGSITAGIPNYSQNQSQKSAKPMLETIPQGSIMGTMNTMGTIGTMGTTKGSIVSGTPQTFTNQFPNQSIVSQSGPTTTNTHMTNQPQVSMFSGTISTGFPNQSQGTISNFGANQGSIMSGTPMNSGTSFGSTMGSQNQGSIMSGTPLSTSTSFGTISTQNQGSIMSGTPMNTSTSFGTIGTQQGSIMSGIPMGTNNNYGTTNQNQGSIMSGTPMNTNFDTTTSFSTNFGTSPNFGNIANQTFGSTTANNYSNANYNMGQQNFGTNSTSSTGFGTSTFGSITSGTPMPSGSITAGTPFIPTTNANYNQSQYSARQRKYSGPQRVKLQMLATVQEIGNFVFFFLFRAMVY